MTRQSMEALMVKRAIDTKKAIDAKEMMDQGYSLAEIACYIYAVTMAQVKKDILPITAAEACAATGASLERVPEVVKNYLLEKENDQGDKSNAMEGYFMITPSKVRKIAQQKGISITLVSIFKSRGDLYLEMADLPPDVQKRNLESGLRRNTVEADRIIRKYNRQAKKIAAALRELGVKIGGRPYGSGEWGYTTREWTNSDELVWNNID